MFSKLISNIQTKLQEFHKIYTLAPDKIEIKREILFDYQLKITDIYNIPIANIKELVFDEEKYLN